MATLTPDLGPGNMLACGIEEITRRAELRVLTSRFLDGGSCTRCRRNGEIVAVGSYTSMSKGKATAGGSTSHTPGMAGRG